MLPKHQRHCEEGRHRERSEAISRLLRRLRLLAMTLAIASSAAADDSPFQFDGHTKLRAVGQTYPADSLFRDIAGSSSVDTIGEARLNFGAKSSGWSVRADYQLLGIHSEFLALGLPSDDRRLLDLTKVISDGSEHAWLHRLDRLLQDLGHAGAARENEAHEGDS